VPPATDDVVRPCVAAGVFRADAGGSVSIDEGETLLAGKSSGGPAYKKHIQIQLTGQTLLVSSRSRPTRENNRSFAASGVSRALVDGRSPMSHAVINLLHHRTTKFHPLTINCKNCQPTGIIFIRIANSSHRFLAEHDIG